jgi:hypothetical protein
MCQIIDILIIFKFNLEQAIMAPLESKLSMIKRLTDFVKVELSQKAIEYNKWPNDICHHC